MNTVLFILLTFLQFCGPSSLFGGGGIGDILYAYDGANNRTSKAVTGGATTTYSYDSCNELTSSSDGHSYTYDANGNRATHTLGGVTDTYSYDFENRLIELVKNTSGGVGTYAYGYDYLDRRIVRDESGAGGVLTQVVFSGDESVQEYTGTISSGNLTVEYIRGSNEGGDVGSMAYTLRGGTPSYTHENRRGDVVAKTDASGNLTFQNQYDGLGNSVASSGSTPDRQKANTQEDDPAGLTYYHHRYLDRAAGIWLTRDPAFMVNGPNLYCYCEQNYWTKFDVDGLNDTFGYNGPGESLLPDPEAGIKQASQGWSEAFDSSKSLGSRSFGVLEGVGESLDTAVGLIPGEGAAEHAVENVVKKEVEHVVEGEAVHAAETTVTKGAKDVAQETGAAENGGAAVTKPDVHGNSKQSMKTQHTYDIYQKGENGEADTLYKTGVSGGKLTHDGTKSARATSQVNALNKDAGSEKYYQKVTETNIPGRQAALDKEQARVDQHARENNGVGPRGNQKPQPTPEGGG